jgi:hypothetical protein
MVYLGIHGPRGDVVSPGIFRLRKANDGNTGTHAYIVRHGALRTKLLPKLKYMMDAIDQQYTEHFDTVNAYGFQTQLAKQDDALESTIQKM